MHKDREHDGHPNTFIPDIENLLRAGAIVIYGTYCTLICCDVQGVDITNLT